MMGQITRKDMMPLNPILEVKIFDVWGIYFIGPFPSLFGNQYILVTVNYVSQWVKAEPTRMNDTELLSNF